MYVFLNTQIPNCVLLPNAGLVMTIFPTIYRGKGYAQ